MPDISYEEQVIQNCEQHREFRTGASGFIYWEPPGGKFYTFQFLFVVANYLKEKNDNKEVSIPPVQVYWPNETMEYRDFWKTRGLGRHLVFPNGEQQFCRPSRIYCPISLATIKNRTQRQKVLKQVRLCKMDIDP